jgi:hypothetical protein
VKILFFEKVKDRNLYLLKAESLLQRERHYSSINEEIDKLINGDAELGGTPRKSFTTARKQILILHYLVKIERGPRLKKAIEKKTYYSFLEQFLNTSADNLEDKHLEYFDWTEDESLIQEFRRSKRKALPFLKDLEEVKAHFESIGFNECGKLIQLDIDRFLPFLKS